jgi:hypothetical protein
LPLAQLAPYFYVIGSTVNLFIPASPQDVIDVLPCDIIKAMMSPGDRSISASLWSHETTAVYAAPHELCGT